MSLSYNSLDINFVSLSLATFSRRILTENINKCLNFTRNIKTLDLTGFETQMIEFFYALII